jgi:hypothetical protein
MQPETASTTDLLGLLASIESDLAARATDAKIRRALTAIADRTMCVSRRLESVSRSEYKEWMGDVLRRPKSDLIHRFSRLLGEERIYLIGENREYASSPEAFLRLLQRVVADFANFTDDTTRGKRCKR